MKKAKFIYFLIIGLIVLVFGFDVLSPIEHVAHVVVDSVTIALLMIIASFQTYLLFFWKPKIIEDNGIVEDLDVFNFFIDKSLKRLYRVGNKSAGRSAVVYINVAHPSKMDSLSGFYKKQQVNDIDIIADIIKKALRRSDLIALNHKKNIIFVYLDDVANDQNVIETTERILTLIDKNHYTDLYIGVAVSKFDHLQSAEELFNRAMNASGMAKQTGQQIYFSVV